MRGSAPSATPTGGRGPGIMGRVAQVDPDQLAALRRIRAAFGDVEVLAVIDDDAGDDQAARRVACSTRTLARISRRRLDRLSGGR
jgi:hypothetical protein